jgi:hypothetical protein
VAGVLALVGVAVMVAFTMISGMQYASREAEGLAPGAAPEWILAGQVGGGLLIVTGVLIALFLALRLLLAPRGTGAPTRDGGHYVEAGHQYQGTPPPGSR